MLCQVARQSFVRKCVFCFLLYLTQCRTFLCQRTSHECRPKSCHMTWPFWFQSILILHTSSKFCEYTSTLHKYVNVTNSSSMVTSFISISDRTHLRLSSSRGSRRSFPILSDIHSISSPRISRFANSSHESRVKSRNSSAGSCSGTGGVRGVYLNFSSGTSVNVFQSRVQGKITRSVNFVA